jgi:DNA-binding transcriptional LysR family regulator
VLNSLETRIAIVSPGHGVAVIPALGRPACRKRGIVAHRQSNHTVTVDYHVIQQRGKKLAPAAEDCAAFLQRYIARWAGASGILTSSPTVR